MEENAVFTSWLQPLNSKGVFAWKHARFSSKPFLSNHTQWEHSLPSYPTAVVLTIDRRDVILLNDTDFFSKVEWEKEDRDRLEEKYKCDFERLYDEWEEKCLFVHPIKLSRWNL